MSVLRKKIFSSILLASLFIWAGVSGFSFGIIKAEAATNTSNILKEEVKAGLVPGNMFYFLDQLSEKTDILFTFSKSKKAFKKINYAEERLAELGKIISGNKFKYEDALIQSYEKLNISALNYLKSVNDHEQLAKIKNSIMGKIATRPEIVSKILDRLSENQKQRLIKIIAMMLDVKEENQDATASLVIDYRSENDFPEVLKLGMDVSQWGPTYTLPYYRNKFHKENNPKLYRMGLNLRSYASEEAESIDDYLSNLKKLDEIILSYKANGADVIMTFYGVPKALSSKCEKDGNDYKCSENWGIAPPRDYNEWANLVERIVRHYKNELGVDLFYEVWNEADQNYVFRNDDFWISTEEEYFKLYKYSVIGAMKADRDVKIGGPGSSVWDHDVIENFLEYAAKEKLRVSFVTWHMYVGWNGFKGEKKEMETISRSVRGWIKENGFDEKTPLIIDEFNYDPGLQKPLEHETEFTASYFIYALENMIGSIDRQTFFHFNDFQNSELFAGDPGAISRDGVIKPVYNAMRALSILSGKNEKETPFFMNISKSDDSISALASKTKDGGKIRILLSYFIPEVSKAKFYEFLGGQENKKEISLKIKNIPFSGSANLTAYTIDRENSNSCRYNKKTEPVQSNTECGLNGEIDSAVRKASQDSQKVALSEIKNYLKSHSYADSQIKNFEKSAQTCLDQDDKKTCFENQIKTFCAPTDSNCADIKNKIIPEIIGIYNKIKNPLFYYGNRGSFVGSKPEITEFIDKINSNPRVSLEGSKKENKVEINKNGDLEMTLEVNSYGVILIEISK